MAQFDVVDMNGKKVSTVELSDAVFGITPNEKAVHEAVVNFLANQRQGTQNTKALLSALSDKAANGNLIVVDKIAADEYKTKTVVAFLAAVGAGKKNLIVNDTLDAKFVKSAANIPGVQTAATGINTYDVVNADKLILSVDAAKKLEEVYA